MVDKLKVLVAIFCIAIGFGAWPSSGKFGSVYTGPCDLIVCAEAYSVTRAMKAAYTGPLFQIKNATGTLDVGQINHQADMTTWSSFCGHATSNCTYSKIYSQINAISNTLTPFTSAVPAPFGIETSTTGLPIINADNLGPGGGPGSGSEQYAIGGPSDNASVGITAGGAAETVLLNGTGITQTTNTAGFCCGVFGTAHLYNGGNVGGTDFLIELAWTNNGASRIPCGTTSTFCVGIDEESGSTGPAVFLDYSGVIMNYVAAVTWDGSTTMNMYLNGRTLQTSTGTSGLNSGTRIHLAGGGDLTGPAPVHAREMLITNSALTPTQIASVFSNNKTFYPALTFEIGNRPATYAAGPGDIVSGAQFWGGLRAYTAAIAAAGTQKLINVILTGNSHTCDIIVAANGGLGNTANCSNGGDNGKTVTAFCTNSPPDALGVGAGMDCEVETIYDQSGNGINFSTAGTAPPRLALNCINFAPCIVFDAAVPNFLNVAPANAGSNQPYSYSMVAARVGNTTQGNVLSYNGAASTGRSYHQFGGSANQFNSVTDSSSTFPAIVAAETDNFPHAIQTLFSGSSSSLTVDGTTTTGTLGTDNAPPSPSHIWIGSDEFNQLCTCQISEVGFWPLGFTPTQKTNMNANQHSYWGF